MNRLRSNIAALGVLAALHSTTAFSETFSAGIRVTDEMRAEETGLSVFPGAKRVEKNLGEGAILQFSFGDYGLKIVVVNLHTDESPARVAAFYRDDLARYGSVLDCTHVKPAAKPDPENKAKAKAKASTRLTCNSDTAPTNGMLYRAGTTASERVVSIKPRGAGAEVTLVHVRVKAPT